MVELDRAALVHHGGDAIPRGHGEMVVTRRAHVEVLVQIAGQQRLRATGTLGEHAGRDAALLELRFIVFLLASLIPGHGVLPCRERSISTATTSLSTRSEEHTSELQSRQYLVCR